MTEVMPETPMKIQEQEIKVQDAFEHLIKILDISEQNVNNMKEWMHSKVLRTSSKFLDLSTETQMEGWTIHKHRGETKLSSLTCGIQSFPALSLRQGIHQQPPNAYNNGCLGQPDQGRISTMED